MKKLNLISIVILNLFSLAVHAKEIALSFDDAPRDATGLVSAEERTTLLSEGLAHSGVKTVFFCNTERFLADGKARIDRYVRAGHLIANHSDSHPDLDQISAEDYWSDVLKADQILNVVPIFRKWFRFPFLHEGRTVEKRDFIRMKMSKANYVNGYVTIDNADWYIDDFVQRKKKEGFSVNISKLRKLYVSMIIDSVEFYDKLALQVLGRSPKHVLLLHENDLAALYIKDLIEALQEKDWKIISPDSAYEDPTSKIEPDTLVLNQGRVAAMARAQGFKGSIWSKFEEESEIEKVLEDGGVFHR